MNKVIKNISALSIMLLICGTLLYSCKKEVEPELVVKVVDYKDSALAGFDVLIYVNGIDPNKIDRKVLDHGFTDSEGKYSKVFPNTVVVDVAAFKLDSIGDTILSGMDTYRVEETRQKSKHHYVKHTLVLH